MECEPVKMLLSDILAEDEALTGACGPELELDGRTERRLLLLEAMAGTARSLKGEVDLHKGLWAV